jgi:hypothetical protein
MARIHLLRLVRAQHVISYLSTASLIIYEKGNIDHAPSRPIHGTLGCVDPFPNQDDDRSIL